MTGDISFYCVLCDRGLRYILTFPHGQTQENMKVIQTGYLLNVKQLEL